jgi:His-Xaa-Ser system protein HxsD
MKEAVLRVSEDIYPAPAVLSACYRFLERAYFFVERESPKAKVLKVHIKPRENGGGVKALRGAFLNELVYASLRHTLARENRKIREFIVGSALYAQAGFAKDDLFLSLGAGYEKDPLGIARSLKRRRGKKTASGV